MKRPDIHDPRYDWDKNIYYPVEWVDDLNEYCDWLEGEIKLYKKHIGAGENELAPVMYDDLTNPES